MNVSEEALDIITELASEVEDYVEHYYKGTLDYPSQQTRYNRDMWTVRRARAFIKEQKPNE